MLKTQEYLRSGKTLEALHLEFDIDVLPCSTLPLVAFNYTLFTPMDEEVSKECRGLILELETWDVVSKSVPAFFENTNAYAAETHLAFDWSSARAYEKYDGFLCCFYFYQHTWRVGMRMEADARNYPAQSINGIENHLSIYDLTVLAVEDMGHDWTSFLAALDPNIIYDFELCAPEIRCGVIYPNRFLRVFAAIHRPTLQEISLDELFWPQEKAKYAAVRSEAEMFDLLKVTPEPYESEGFVAVDKYFHRLKYINPNYPLMFSSRTLQSEKDVLAEMKRMVRFNTTGTLGSLDTGTLGSLSVGVMSVVPSAPHPLLMRILSLAKRVNDDFEKQKGEDVFNAKESVWPAAFTALSEGRAMSQFLDSASDDEILEALEKHERRLN